MNYDELEALYYIELQKNKVLEKQNNDLYLSNAALETTNIVLENDLAKANSKFASVSATLADKICAIATLEIKISTLQNELSIIELAKNITNTFNPTQRQEKANTGMILPQHSIHKPMNEYKLPPNQTSVILSVSDVFGAYSQIDPHDYDKKLHIYAKMGNQLLRYSGASMLQLDRTQDFDVVLEQMIDEFKRMIGYEYYNRNGTLHAPHF